MADDIMHDRIFTPLQDSPKPNHEDPLRQEFFKTPSTAATAPDERSIFHFKIPPEFTDPPEFTRKFVPIIEIAGEKEPAKAVTPQRIEQVNSEMEKNVNELIPDNVQATLKQIRLGVLEANPAAIEKAYEGLKDNPKLLHAMVKELNNEFRLQNSEVKFGLSDDGRLLISSDGRNGIEFGASGPEAKQVTGADDGYIHLAAMQGKSPAIEKVMKDLQENACRAGNDYLGMTNPFGPNTVITPWSELPLKYRQPTHLRPGEVWDSADQSKVLGR